MSDFRALGLIEPLLRAAEKEGYTEPTPIQETTIPALLEGRDLLGQAQTGTGKTAAFAFPILQRLYPHGSTNGDYRPVRALVLTPTRELAAQIDESFKAYGRYAKLRHAVVYGGVRQRSQVSALTAGVDILTATPGRLLDLYRQRLIDFRSVEVFVLDEADRMLDMGFIDDVREIVRLLPDKRQTLLFSATMPHRIQSLANSILTNPIEVRVTPERPAPITVEQAVFLVEKRHKSSLLEHLLGRADVTRALVFTRTKRAADNVTLDLRNAGIRAEAMHADRPQNAREKALENFKQGKVRVLVASNIASRGIDIDDISHVVNFDVPDDPTTYVHRIGRTGRAGAVGTAWTFCSIEERFALDAIERLINQNIPAVDEHPFPSPLGRKVEEKAKPPITTRRPVSRMRRR